MIFTTISDPPTIKIHETNKSLVCSVESKPTANVKWLLDGKRIEGEELIEKEGVIFLKIESTKLRGNLTCRAENRHGVAEEHLIFHRE